MRKATILVILALCAASALCQEGKKPLDVKIASIEGPCLKIIGDKCYNAYETDSLKDPQGEFGYYEFSDKSHKVTLTEKYDCSRPNKRVKWGKSYPSDPDAKFSIYQSKQVKGLYITCYGDVLAKLNGKCSHGLKAFSCSKGTCCP